MKNMAQLASSIYALAGMEFDIDSSKALAEILSGKLGLPGIKKQITVYDVSEKTLLKLADKHPIVPLILEYREKESGDGID